MKEKEYPHGRHYYTIEQFIKEHKPKLFFELCRDEKLEKYVSDLDVYICNKAIEIMNGAMKKEGKDSDEYRNSNPEKWAQEMTTHRHIAEENLLKELVYNA